MVFKHLFTIRLPTYQKQAFYRAIKWYAGLQIFLIS